MESNDKFDKEVFAERKAATSCRAFWTWLTPIFLCYLYLCAKIVAHSPSSFLKKYATLQ